MFGPGADIDPGACLSWSCTAAEKKIVIARLKFWKRILRRDIAEKIAVFIEKAAVAAVAFKILPR